MVAAGELEAGVEYVGIGGLGVDVFGVAAGAGVLTLTARFMGLGFGVLTLTARAKFEGLIETDGPKEVVRLI